MTEWKAGDRVEDNGQLRGKITEVFTPDWVELHTDTELRRGQWVRQGPNDRMWIKCHPDNFVKLPTQGPKMTHAEIRAKLSPEDREKYDHDFCCFGNAAVRELDDGRYVYVPLTEIDASKLHR